ncbi:DUF4232 domain-containing protein [Pseudonocardia spirodelae]|uniref:DUF4232 domain-containing protein n=1 Tax=Pseudonocardia spirodelae TaxID=3133431 RepID=A0ABU8T2T4_9PSEU
MTTRRATLAAGLLLLLCAGCGGGGGTPAALSTAPAAAPDTARQPDTARVGRCTAASLQASVGTTLGDDQKDTTIVWRNTSDRACTMTGFGGVDLRGSGPAYSLPRSSEEPTTVTVKPGGTAHTVITWLPGTDWTPADVVVTAPDETTSTTLRWEQGPVLRQDGATRPGTFIHPVAPGSV